MMLQIACLSLILAGMSRITFALGPQRSKIESLS
jgi:hypothetical protein